jgi:hypothetical protein
VEEDLQNQVEQLTSQLNQLKTEHYQLVKTNEEHTSKLKSELSNSLNASYLKNVLSSYFTTTDTAVQANLIKVVFKVMKFEQEEQDRIMEVWS